jgi:hypothetical protein
MSAQIGIWTRAITGASPSSGNVAARRIDGDGQAFYRI